LELALQASGLDDVTVKHRPRLMSDNGPSYIANDLSKWLGEHDVKHTRGKPYHPMTQGKIERWHAASQLQTPHLSAGATYLQPGLKSQGQNS
jgi:transposase InsO family protein